MPRYSYTAKSSKGEDKEGVLGAKDRYELARALHREGYVLISAVTEEEKAKKNKLEISIPFLDRVTLTDKMMFTRNLQVMIDTALPLPRSLGILAEQSRSKKLKEALLDIREEISGGKSFSESLGKYPDIFPDIFQSMIKAGEEAGNLDEVLQVLTRQMEREHEVSSKIKGALTYPAVIVIAMMGIGILMLIMVVPKLAETFEELNIELPPATKLVIAIGMLLSNFWYLIPLMILALFFLLRAILKIKRGKRIMDALVLKIPVVSSIVKKTNAAYTARTLGSLIASGVPIVRSLEVVSGALGNIYFREAIDEAAKKVREGDKLSDVLKSYQNIYPLLIIQMIEVGEETGETSSILQKLAEFFEEEVTNTTKNLSSIIEPILMLLVGGVVGFFAISMVQPMYSMLGAIK
ncbi:type II secretion system F family protein [Patescibacteria group bacterium]